MSTKGVERRTGPQRIAVVPSHERSNRERAPSASMSESVMRFNLRDIPPKPRRHVGRREFIV